jgi:hypothetical protein
MAASTQRGDKETDGVADASLSLVAPDWTFAP